MSIKKDRTGEISYNKFGSRMVLIRYNQWDNVDVYFPDYNWLSQHKAYKNFKEGTIKCPYEPRIYGKGYIGEGEYKTVDEKYGKQNKAYKTWSHMLERCYDDEHRDKFKTYKDCEVCNEWLNYQNFAEWFHDNYYEIDNDEMCLDKDIIIKGNKIYGPDTCVFVNRHINSLFTRNNEFRGDLPIGVHRYYKGEKYRALCNNCYNKMINLGLYDSVEEAFSKYKKCKEAVIKLIAEEYKNKIPEVLYEALCRYEVEIDD